MKRLAVASILLLAGIAGAWPINTNSTTVSVGTQKAVAFSIPQGEPRVIEALFVNGANPAALTGMTAIYLYRTNNGATWWAITGTVDSAAGAVRFTWDATRDAGALSYYGWVRVVKGDSSPIYRLQVDLTMIPTPGFVPNATALTVAPIDFSGLAWTNEPWAAKGDLVAVNATATNALAVASSKLSVEADPAALPVATNALAQAGTALSWGDHRAAGYVTGEVIRAESDPLAMPVALAASNLASTAVQVEVDPEAKPIATNALAIAQTARGWGDHATNHYATGDFVRVEVDTLATVAGRGGFAGTESIGPLRVTAGKYGLDAGASAWPGVVGSLSIGDYAGQASSGSRVISIGRYAGARGTLSDSVYIDNFDASPGLTYNPTNNMVFARGGALNLGRTGTHSEGLVNSLRGAWSPPIDWTVAAHASFVETNGNGAGLSNVLHALPGSYTGALYATGGNVLTNAAAFATAAQGTAAITNISINGQTASVTDGVAHVSIPLADSVARSMIATLSRNLILTYYRAYVYAPGGINWTDGYISTFGTPNDDYGVGSTGVVYDVVEKAWSNIDRGIGAYLGLNSAGTAFSALLMNRVNCEDIEYGCSIAVWVKLDGSKNTGGTRILADCVSWAEDGAAGGINIQINSSTGQAQVDWWDNAMQWSGWPSSLMGLNDLRDDAWHQVVVTYYDGTMSLYVDGVLDSYTSTTINSQSAGGNGKNRWTFGAENQRTTPSTAFEVFNLFGWIGNIVNFSGAISATDVANLYAASSADLVTVAQGCSGLLLWVLDFRNAAFTSRTPNPTTGAYSLSTTIAFSPATDFGPGPGGAVTNVGAKLVSATTPLLYAPDTVRGSVLCKVDSTNGMALSLSTDDGATSTNVSAELVYFDNITGYSLYDGSVSVTGASTNLNETFAFPDAGGFLRGWSRQVN
jgi:hypothetical protein